MTTDTQVGRNPAKTITSALSPSVPRSDSPYSASSARPVAVASGKAAVPAAGVLDIANDRQEAGFLRTEGCLASSGDVRVPAALIRKAGLRKGTSS